MTNKTHYLYDKKEFIYECSLRGFQGSLSNPTQQQSIASIVREAEKLWDELQEWEEQQPPLKP